MSVQSVTLNRPDVLYQQVKRRAEQTNRTIEAELLAGIPLKIKSG